jgi:hypothetical protein
VIGPVGSQPHPHHRETGHQSRGPEREDHVGIRASLSKGFRLGIENFGTVTGLIILWIVSFILFGMIPYVSGVAMAILSIVLYVALIDLHYQSER